MSKRTQIRLLSDLTVRYERMKLKETDADPAGRTKVCSQCGLVKAALAFSPNTTSPDGLRSNCKECQAKVCTAGVGQKVGERVVGM